MHSIIINCVFQLQICGNLSSLSFKFRKKFCKNLWTTASLQIFTIFRKTWPVAYLEKLSGRGQNAKSSPGMKYTGNEFHHYEFHWANFYFSKGGQKNSDGRWTFAPKARAKKLIIFFESLNENYKMHRRREKSRILVRKISFCTHKTIFFLLFRGAAATLPPPHSDYANDKLA